MVKRLFGLVVVLGALQVLLPQVASAARINFSPSTLTLTEGQSQQVSVTLDEPIICMDIEAPCEVSVAVTTDAPDRVAITTSPVVIPANQWLQVFHFTVTAIDDNLDNGDVTPTVTTLATSGSEFYSNFSPAFSLTVLDNDDPAPQQEQTNQSDPTNATSTDQNEATLADTGQSTGLITILATTLLAGALLTLKKSRHNN